MFFSPYMCPIIAERLHALKMSVGTLKEDLILDLDSDGRVAAEDARRILKIALGSSPQFVRQAGPTDPSAGGQTGTAQIASGTFDLTFEPEAEVTRIVSAASGGRLSLSNGAVLEIPGDALLEDSKITFSKLDMSSVDREGSFALYGVTGIEDSLKRPASFTVPFGSVPADYVDPDVTVKVLDPQEGWVELPITVDVLSKTVTARTDHFSWIEESWGGKYRDLAEELKGAPVLPLSVPYYGQLGSPWCFAAAAQMLLKFYGQNIEIWDTAQHFGLSTSHGSSITNYYLGNYTSLFARYGGLKLEDDGPRFWWRHASLNGYIMHQLHLNRPVFVALRYGRHAVVVTGYDSQGVWLHDPEGIAIAWALDKTKDDLGEHNFSHYKLSWEQWNSAVNGGSYISLDPFSTTIVTQFSTPLAYTIVLTNGTLANNPPLTINVASPRELGKGFQHGKSAGFSFFRFDPDSGVERRFFTWDGTQTRGYKFVTAPFGAPQGLSNSDTLEQLHVTVSNGEPIGRFGQPSQTSPGVTVTAYIDDRQMTQQAATIPAAKSNTRPEVELWKPGSTLNFAELDPPFAPGEHILRLELAIGDAVIDTILIYFTLAPAQVQNVKFRLRGDEAEVTAEVTWDQNIEPAADVEELEYIVLVDGREVSTTEDTRKTISIPGIDPLPDIRVVARTKVRKSISSLPGPRERILASFLSKPAVPAEGFLGADCKKFTFEGTAFGTKIAEGSQSGELNCTWDSKTRSEATGHLATVVYFPLEETAQLREEFDELKSLIKQAVEETISDCEAEDSCKVDEIAKGADYEVTGTIVKNQGTARPTYEHSNFYVTIYRDQFLVLVGWEEAASVVIKFREGLTQQMLAQAKALIDERFPPVK